MILKRMFQIYLLTCLLGCASVISHPSKRELSFNNFRSVELLNTTRADIQNLFGPPDTIVPFNGIFYWYYYSDVNKPVDPRMGFAFNKNNKVNFKTMDIYVGEIERKLPELLKNFPSAKLEKKMMESQISHVVTFDYSLIDSALGLHIYVDGNKEEVKYLSLESQEVPQLLTTNK